MESTAIALAATDDVVSGWGFVLLVADCLAFWAVVVVALIAFF